MQRTVAQVGEFRLIAEMVGRLRQGPAVLLGPGDDAAVVAAADGRVVATTDLLVEGRHFRRDWSSAVQVGRKAAAQNLADVAAMGAVPTAVLVGLAAPADLEADWVLDLVDGLRTECGLVGASVVGGDTVRGEALTVAVTALGDLRGRAPVTRSGARDGDVVAVAGHLGWSAAGLAALLAADSGTMNRDTTTGGTSDSDTTRAPRIAADAEPFVAAHRSPSPPYAAGPWAADAGATAMIDTSDGLLADLGHVAAASGVRIDLRTAAIEIPAAMRRLADTLGADPLAWVLTGGEDHCLAATFPPHVPLADPWRVVGAVTAVTPTAPAGTTVDGAAFEGRGGYDHFS